MYTWRVVGYDALMGRKVFGSFPTSTRRRVLRREARRLLSIGSSFGGPRGSAITRRLARKPRPKHAHE